MREREIEWIELMQSADAGDGAGYLPSSNGNCASFAGNCGRWVERAGLPTDQCEMIVQEILLAVHLKRHAWDASAPVFTAIRDTRDKLLGVTRSTGEPGHIDCFRES